RHRAAIRASRVCQRSRSLSVRSSRARSEVAELERYSNAGDRATDGINQAYSDGLRSVPKDRLRFRRQGRRANAEVTQPHRVANGLRRTIRLSNSGALCPYDGRLPDSRLRVAHRDFGDAVRLVVAIDAGYRSIVDVACGCPADHVRNVAAGVDAD